MVLPHLVFTIPMVFLELKNSCKQNVMVAGQINNPERAMQYGYNTVVIELINLNNYGGFKVIISKA